MNYEAMFNTLYANTNPNDDIGVCNDSMKEVVNNVQPQYRDQFSSPSDWVDTFTSYKTSPVLYNLDGYISPYASNNWGGTSKILQYIDDSSRLPAFENKIDPNKIFSSEINALRALAADQQKITKLFEKRLMESLTERGKVGLTEEDVEAMSALTSARGTIANINKEQVAIKKNITDIRIKQSQAAATANGGGSGSNDAGVGRGTSVNDIGRSMLDNIFMATGTPVVPSQTVVDYSPTDAGAAGAVLDAIVAPPSDVQLKNELNEPVTYAVVGDSDTDIEFVTYGSDGNIIPDYPHPDISDVSRVDRDGGNVYDTTLMSYKIKNKNEM